ncbi:MAG: lactose operon transcription activator [Chthoniobacteraceae bacterium]|nr:lactose operon transcription activator [Chthoniobacteraceae bacterium]
MQPTSFAGAQRPTFVSVQVSEARRYYLDLAPPPGRKLSVVCGGCERIRPDYRVERQTFPFFAIEFVAEGEGILELAGRQYRLKPGMAFAYGPGIPHIIRSDGTGRPMLKYYVDFTGTDAKAILEQSPLGAWEAVQVSSPKEVIELLEMIQREGGSESSYGALICALLVPVVILKITERAVPCGTGELRSLATYQRVKQWIESHYKTINSIGQVAGACGVEPAYLSRLFQRFGHTTPYRFLMRLKMNRAAELLLDGGLMVKEVASELDFADAFHFSRAFKRIYGIPPERFLKSSRG